MQRSARRALVGFGLGFGLLLLAPTASAANPAVQINSGVAATTDPSVSLTIAPPVDSRSMLRISNDGGTTWVETSYATSIAWSLIDPAAGGYDADGTKTLTVESGDGVGAWSSLGSAKILLDRTGPIISGYSPGEAPPMTGWLGNAHPDASDGVGVGIASTEVSLDGVHWAVDHFYNSGGWGYVFFDYRDGIIGGTWQPGPRTLWVRMTDKLGNVGPAFEADGYATESWGYHELPAMFTFPKPAVVGQQFTIQPVYDAGFSVPPGSFCQWSMIAGDWDVRQAYYNPTLIRADTNVSPVNGVCPAWTFTLPYTAPMEYQFGLAVMSPTMEQASYFATSGTFRADPGTTTSRAFTYSSLPMYYILPDRDYVADDGTVTYRLYRAGGAPDRSAGGLWYCEPADVPQPPGGYAPQDQHGGTSFTCSVTSTGPWAATWVTYAGIKRWLVQYDPVGDVRAPSVSTPGVLAGGLSPSASNPPVTVKWSGHDVGTGLFKYLVERSVDGGKWTSVPLTSARATSLTTRLHVGHSYRFRVRARDKVGNWSPWHVSATVRPAFLEENASLLRWSSGWTRAAQPGASGGAVKFATSAGRSVTFTFTGRSVGWFAQRGPGQGFAQVRVDGVLVATVNVERATVAPSAVVWRTAWTASGTHRVTITTLGTAGRPRVELDAIEVVR